MIGSALILMIIFAINITVIHRTFLNGDYYKNVLEESNIYESAPELISDLISTALEEAVEQNIEEQMGIATSSESVDISTLKQELNPLIESSVTALITPELLRETAETNIDNITNFLQGKSDDLIIFIPRDTLLNNLKAEAPKIEQNVKDTISNFPTCSDAEANNLENALGGGAPGSQSVVIDCIPAQIKADVLNEEHFSALGDIDTFIAELEKKNPELAKNEFSVSELMDLKEDEDTTESERQEIKDEYDSNREIVQNGFRYSKFAFIGLWGLIIALLVFYALLSKGDVWSKIASALKVTFVASLINLIPAAIVKYLLISSTVNEANFHRVTNSDIEIDEDSLLSIIKLLRELFDNIVTPIVLFSAAICIGSLVLIIVFKMISKKEDKTEKVIQEISKTEVKKEEVK